MPELPDHTPDRDRLTDRLAGLAHDATQQSRLLTAPEIRHRAARRRTGQVAAVAAATAVVIGVGWSVAAPGANDAGREPLQPAGSTSGAPTPSQPDMTSKDLRNTPAPSQSTGLTDAPTLPALPAPAGPGPTPPGGWVTTIPATVKLPSEGVQSTSSESSDWKPLPVDTWLLTPCSRAERSGYPSDGARTDLRSIGSQTIEGADSAQLAAYSSDTGAIAAMSELRQAVVDCKAVRTTSKDGTSHESFWSFADAVDRTSTPSGEHPDEAFAAWNWNRTYDPTGNPEYGLGGGFFVVTRVGNAIFLTAHDGETDFGDNGQVQRASVEYSKITRAFLPTLCSTFADADGC